MTWHAQAGQLVLSGGEANLFRDAILSMGDAIVEAEDDEESVFGGARVFDRMGRSQQLASLEVVARYLFHQTPECLSLTAWSEATLASVLREVQSLVILELEEGETDERRQVVLEALGAHDDIEDPDDIEAWKIFLEAYEDRFLWDMDYEDDGVTDLSPEHSRQTRAMMGIVDDYYSAIPPDLGVADSLRRAAKRVWMVIDGKKTFRLTASLTCELPASLCVKKIDDDLMTLLGVCPLLTLAHVDSEGSLVEASDEQHEFFFDDGLLESVIEEAPETDLKEKRP